MAEARLKELGITLPEAPSRGGVYLPSVLSGRYLYISGCGPLELGRLKSANGKTGEGMIRGMVGRDLSLDEAKLAARQVRLTP